MSSRTPTRGGLCSCPQTRETSGRHLRGQVQSRIRVELIGGPSGCHHAQRARADRGRPAGDRWHSCRHRQSCPPARRRDHRRRISGGTARSKGSRWFPIYEALRKLTYKNEREALEKAALLLEEVEHIT